MKDYDLIIVGGGLVGTGFALALQSSPLRIALIDARLPHQDDPRLFGLTNSSCQFLKNLGLWPALAAQAAPIHQVHVSYRGHFGAVRLQREIVGLPALGHVIPAAAIEAALNERITLWPQLTQYRPATLRSLEQHAGRAILTLMTAEGERVIQAPIVIGADGTDSTVRAQLAIDVKTVHYEQSAIVTRTILKRTHHQIAYERFDANGAIAMLPLSSLECATIWTADNQTVDSLMAMSEDAFLQQLQHHFGYRLGRLSAIKARYRFPLRMVCAQKMIDQCVLLLGNAAHTLHPIAAQGFNLALYEVAVLAEEIMKKTACQHPLTMKDLEAAYLRIQKQQGMSIGISHRLSSMFSKQSFIMQAALPWGMIGLDWMTSMKKKLMNRLIGRAGLVPLLLTDQNE